MSNEDDDDELSIWHDPNWILYANGTMAECFGCVTPYSVTGPKIAARYVLFVIKSYFGIAGGLNYFRPNAAPAPPSCKN
jgi:hypothetical protein